MAQQQHSSEEVDLGYLFKSIGGFFKKILRTLFLILDFFKKYFIIIIILLIIGFAYGYYKDYNAIKTYDNEVIVIPNFESVDYLYDKVEAINKKIASGDTIYLQNVPIILLQIELQKIVKEGAYQENFLQSNIQVSFF